MANAQYRVDNQGSGGGSFVIGLLAGTVIGAGVAMLFASKPGSELRRDLGEQADKLATDASKTYRKASVGAAEWARKASEAAEGIAERGKEIYDNARDAVAKGADEVQRYRQEASGTSNGTGSASSTHPDGSGSFNQAGSTGPRAT